MPDMGTVRFVIPSAFSLLDYFELSRLNGSRRETGKNRGLDWIASASVPKVGCQLDSVWGGNIVDQDELRRPLSPGFSRSPVKALKQLQISTICGRRSWSDGYLATKSENLALDSTLGTTPEKEKDGRSGCNPVGCGS